MGLETNGPMERAVAIQFDERLATGMDQPMREKIWMVDGECATSQLRYLSDRLEEFYHGG